MPITKTKARENRLDDITRYSKGITKEVSIRYKDLVYDIRRNISYNLDIVYVKGVHDKTLGDVDIKRIQRFIKDNLN